MFWCKPSQRTDELNGTKMVRRISSDARSVELQGVEAQVFQSIIGATENRREKTGGVVDAVE